jgi:hypothetical protein
VSIRPQCTRWHPLLRPTVAVAPVRSSLPESRALQQSWILIYSYPVRFSYSRDVKIKFLRAASGLTVNGSHSHIHTGWLIILAAEHITLIIRKSVITLSFESKPTRLLKDIKDTKKVPTLFLMILRLRKVSGLVTLVQLPGLQRYRQRAAHRPRIVRAHPTLASRKTSPPMKHSLNHLQSLPKTTAVAGPPMSPIPLASPPQFRQC